jgi:hypothetical protein
MERAFRRASSGLPLVPLSVESLGRLGTLALSLLRSLADHVVQVWGPGLSQDAFIPGAHRELGVAVCRGNTPMGRSGLYNLTRMSGRAPLRGLSRPLAEVVSGCPRLPFLRSPWLICVGASGACLVWVCLVWLAFACVWPRLLCVLLLIQPRLPRLSAPMLLGVSLVPLCK